MCVLCYREWECRTLMLSLSSDRHRCHLKKRANHQGRISACERCETAGKRRSKRRWWRLRIWTVRRSSSRAVTWRDICHVNPGVNFIPRRSIRPGAAAADPYHFHRPRRPPDGITRGSATGVRSAPETHPCRIPEQWPTGVPLPRWVKHLWKCFEREREQNHLEYSWMNRNLSKTRTSWMSVNDSWKKINDRSNWVWLKVELG